VLVVELVGDVAVQHGILLQPLAPLSVLHLSVVPLLIAATLGPCLQWTCGQYVFGSGHDNDLMRVKSNNWTLLKTLIYSCGRSVKSP
jgi:hypothetical protein